MKCFRKWSVRLGDCVSHKKKVKGVKAAILPFQDGWMESERLARLASELDGTARLKG